MGTGITKLFNENGEQIITSLDIAKLTGKEHRNVLRDIKLECLYIATKYDDVSRAKLVLRWEELERANVRTQGTGTSVTSRATSQMSQSPCASPKLLTTEREILRKGDEIRRGQIEKENAPADGCFTISEVAEMLKTSVKELNQFLVKQDIQFRRDGRYYLTPKYEGRGLAKDRLFSYYALDGEKKERSYMVWTKLGVEMIMAACGLNDK